MLDDLSFSSSFMLVLSVIIGGFAYAWVADAVLGRLGFGIFLTSVLSIGSAYGGLLAMDWGVRTHQIPYGFQSPPVWAVAAITCMTVTVLGLSVLKRVVVR